MSRKKLDREDEILLQKYADTLPCVMHQTHEVHRLTGAEILEMGYEEYNGEKLIPAKIYEYMMPVQVAANHFNRLKRAWLKDGQDGLTAYFKGIAKLME